jgi:hypothetical protein
MNTGPGLPAGFLSKRKTQHRSRPSSAAHEEHGFRGSLGVTASQKMVRIVTVALSARRDGDTNSQEQPSFFETRQGSGKGIIIGYYTIGPGTW